MKYLFLILLLFHLQAALAQDTLVVKPLKAVEQKLLIGKQKLDTLIARQDSLKKAGYNKVDSLKKINLTGKVQSKSDSAKNAINGKINKVETSLSLAPVQHRVDSVSGRITKKIEDAENKLEKKINDQVTKAEGKVNNLNKLGTEADATLKDVNSDLKQILPNSKGADIKVPGAEFDVPKADLKVSEEVKKSMNEFKLEGEGNKLPGVELDQSILKDKGMEDVKDRLPDTNKVKEKIDQLDVVDKTKDQLQTISNTAKEIEKYNAELEKIKSKELDELETKELEKEIIKRSGAEGIDAKTKEFAKLQAEHTALLEKSRDTKLMKAELTRKLKNVANEQINMKSPVVKKAIDELEKVKKLNAQVEDVKKLTRKRDNELKGVPMRERLLPGIGMQIYSNSIFSMDVAPQLGYRFSKRLTSGMAGVYRFSVDKNITNYVQSTGVYGLRAYADFATVKSFFLHGEIESLSLQDRINPGGEELSRNVLASAYGVGSQFNFTNRIKMTTYGLYRLEHKGHLPGSTKINLRMIFSISPKKKR